MLETANLFSKDGLVFKSYLSKIGDHGFVCNVRYVNRQIPTDVIEVFCVYLEDAKRDQLVTVVVEAPEQTFEPTLQAMLPTMKNINLE